MCGEGIRVAALLLGRVYHGVLSDRLLFVTDVIDNGLDAVIVGDVTTELTEKTVKNII